MIAFSIHLIQYYFNYDFIIFKRNKMNHRDQYNIDLGF